jgi:hypothetical protein
MREKVREIMEGFLPAMDKIQSTNESDEQKKRNAKEWLRSKLNSLLEEAEKKQSDAMNG